MVWRGDTYEIYVFCRRAGQMGGATGYFLEAS